MASGNLKIIVLDDDPTGSQTVHSCLLLLRWDAKTLRRGLEDESPLFFVLTNTRSMAPDRAREVTREVCRNLERALAGFSRPWVIVSRSDSTLRGHYPVETDVIAQELGPFDAHFLVPAFFEGGRITRGGTHYVVMDGNAVPAHETPFARDSVFGYSSAYLPDYVEEKTGGRTPSAAVELFDPSELEGAILARLRSLSGNTCCAVSAESPQQLDRFAALALRAVGEGKRFLFRSAASLLTSLARLPEQPVPAGRMGELVLARRPGLVVVGSHVPLSTRQLCHLLASRSPVHVEVDVRALPGCSAEVERDVRERVAAAHSAGRHVVVSTSRTERQFASAAERLTFGAEVSALLVQVVRTAPRTLGFVISKGGITSNDVLGSGLELDAARVVGQIHPGCSVVLTPAGHRLERIPVVIFPGNVGNDESLTLVFDRLAGA